jgi:DNA topoisomerase-3
VGRGAGRAIVAAVQGQPGTVTEESKPVDAERRPLLFDLTTLQREANGASASRPRPRCRSRRRFYEKHKAFTYPRTDSRHLPEDYV